MNTYFIFFAPFSFYLLFFLYPHSGFATIPCSMFVFLEIGTMTWHLSLSGTASFISNIAAFKPVDRGGEKPHTFCKITNLVWSPGKICLFWSFHACLTCVFKNKMLLSGQLHSYGEARRRFKVWFVERTFWIATQWKKPSRSRHGEAHRRSKVWLFSLLYHYCEPFVNRPPPSAIKIFLPRL